MNFFKLENRISIFGFSFANLFSRPMWEIQIHQRICYRIHLLSFVAGAVVVCWWWWWFCHLTQPARSIWPMVEMVVPCSTVLEVLAPPEGMPYCCCSASTRHDSDPNCLNSCSKTSCYRPFDFRSHDDPTRRLVVHVRYCVVGAALVVCSGKMCQRSIQFLRWDSPMSCAWCHSRSTWSDRVPSKWWSEPMLRCWAWIWDRCWRWWRWPEWMANRESEMLARICDAVEKFWMSYESRQSIKFWAE